MKKIIFIATLLSLSIAQAKEFKVYDVTSQFASSWQTFVSFEINPELGRSWIEVIVERGFEDNASDLTRVKIPGLSYDSQFKSINIESEGEIVECAQIKEKGRWIFKQEYIELTERCRFEKREVLVTKDDGFKIYKQKRLHVYLIVE